MWFVVTKTGFNAGALPPQKIYTVPSPRVARRRRVFLRKLCAIKTRNIPEDRQTSVFGGEKNAAAAFMEIALSLIDAIII